MNLKIADINIQINPIYASELNPLFLPYSTKETPKYIIDCQMVEYINPITSEPFMQQKNRYFYHVGTETILQVKHQSGLIKYQIKTNADITHQEILFVESLNQSKSDIAYILISMCFLEVSNKEGYLALHASSLVLHEEVVLFSAPSKTGKSTHVGYYLDEFKHASTLNDDKPIIKNGRVYGTPFSGKTMKNLNQNYPLKAIVFIHQDKIDNVQTIDEDKSIKYIFTNMLRPNQKEVWDDLALIINQLLKFPLFEAGLTHHHDSIFTTYYHLYKEHVMKLKPGFTLKEIGSKTMVIPINEEALNFNGIITLNKSAKCLFEALSEEQTLDSLIELLLDRYEIDEFNARKDVIQFIEILKEKKLLI